VPCERIKPLAGNAIGSLPPWDTLTGAQQVVQAANPNLAAATGSLSTSISPIGSRGVRQASGFPALPAANPLAANPLGRGFVPIARQHWRYTVFLRVIRKQLCGCLIHFLALSPNGELRTLQ
jgi:hypothetical protein